MADLAPSAPTVIDVRFHSRIDDIPAQAWDALRPDDNPFVSHAFLAALERTGCIRANWGWQAHHLCLYEDGQLIAAAPLYLKGNSHGEFVFDWSWASAWERAGGDYYPKLLNAAPYSPVPGPRLLTGTGPQASARRQALTSAMATFAKRMNISSVHANFLRDEELAAFGDEWLARTDVQFHWQNRDHTDFADFLAALNHKKRKNIRQERSHVANCGVAIEMRGGSGLSVNEWQRIHELYESTFDAKGNHAALTREFFLTLGETLGDSVQVAMAHDGHDIVAMALFLQSNDTLYGRYWGGDVDVPGLHFELCYYQGIDYAIRHGLQRFEPGAQGEHKLARGFLPVRTYSRHYLVNEDFRAAVRAALVQEDAAVEEYAQHLQSHSPYARR